MLEIGRKAHLPVLLCNQKQQKNLTCGAAGRQATLFFSKGSVKCYELHQNRSDRKHPWLIQESSKEEKNWSIALKIVVSIMTGFIFPIVMGIILAVYRYKNRFQLVSEKSRAKADSKMPSPLTSGHLAEKQKGSKAGSSRVSTPATPSPLISVHAERDQKRAATVQSDHQEHSPLSESRQIEPIQTPSTVQIHDPEDPQGRLKTAAELSRKAIEESEKAGSRWPDDPENDPEIEPYKHIFDGKNPPTAKAVLLTMGEDPFLISKVINIFSQARRELLYIALNEVNPKLYWKTLAYVFVTDVTLDKLPLEFRGKPTEVSNARFAILMATIVELANQAFSEVSNLEYPLFTLHAVQTLFTKRWMLEFPFEELNDVSKDSQDKFRIQVVDAALGNIFGHLNETTITEDMAVTKDAVTKDMAVLFIRGHALLSVGLEKFYPKSLPKRLAELDHFKGNIESFVKYLSHFGIDFFAIAVRNFKDSDWAETFRQEVMKKIAIMQIEKETLFLNKELSESVAFGFPLLYLFYYWGENSSEFPDKFKTTLKWIASLPHPGLVGVFLENRWTPFIMKNSLDAFGRDKFLLNESIDSADQKVLLNTFLGFSPKYRQMFFPQCELFQDGDKLGLRSTIST